LRSITKSRNRVERFDYAKALLQSDEELEKLSRRIRKEINESELFELALAAERAADAGEDRFSGRASTFGKPLPKTTLPGAKTHQCSKNDPRNVSTRTFSTMSTATIGSSSSYMGRSDDLMRTGIPTIGATPYTPDRRGFMVKTRYHSSPGLILTGSEPSLLEAMVEIAAAAPDEPEKRSMGVDSLRDINEVIPHWNELHVHMRTHLFRESVDKKTLFFNPTESEREKSSSSIISTAPLRSHWSHSSMPKHRRSRSFLESIADIAVPHFGDSKQKKRRQQVRSTGSFDFMSILSKECNNTTQASTTDESESSERLEETLLLNISNCEDNNSSSHASPVSNEVEKPCFKPDALVDELDVERSCDNQREMAVSLATRTSARSQKFELADFEKAIESENSIPPKNRSACSSETTSLASSCSETEIHEMTNNDGEGGSTVFSVGRVSVNAEAQLVNNDNVMISTSLADDDDDSGPPVSPMPYSNLERMSSESYHPVVTQSSNPTPPLTPNNSTITTTRDLGFNTPAHLRVIKGIQKKSRLDEKWMDAPKQPQLRSISNIEEVITTPTVDFAVRYEPNSIIDTAADLPQETRFPERSKASLEEVEARFLALPAITGSVKDSNLKRLPKRRIARRRIKRSQWLDSPTTPTDQISRSFLPNARERQNDFLCEVMPHDYEHRISHVEEDLVGEKNNDSLDKSVRSFLNITHSSSDDKSGIVPVSNIHADVVHLKTEAVSFPVADNDASRFCHSLTEYKEEKKQCEDAVAAHVVCDAKDREEVAEEDAISPAKDSEILSRHQRILVKSLSSPSERCGNENSLERSFNTTKSAPSSRNYSDEENDTYVLRRTDTWDGVVTTDSIDAIAAVNSLISSTSAAVNDAAGFLIGAQKRQSKDTDELISEGSLPTWERRGSANTMIGRLGVGHTLCHGEDNFKAAVQGVLSHLSLSPRVRTQDSEICELILPEPENKEFLHNYFYCPNQRDENQSTKENFDAKNTSMNHSGDDENLDFSSTAAAASAFRERMACVAEPCSGHDPACSMLGVDTVCNGFSYFLFSGRTNDLDGSAGTCPSTATSRNRGNAGPCNEVDAISLHDRRRYRTTSFGKDNLGHSPGTPRGNGIDLQNQHVAGPSHPSYHHHQYSAAGIGERESWLDMFQRVASERFNFHGGDELERSSKHSFTPPCLTRRVLTRTQTK
jgi:hypothetical protein